MSDMRNFISLGAGVQSSTMALLAAHGEITPMPEAAIFADTGAEPRRIYEYLDWLESELPFPVYRVQREKGLKQLIIDSAKGSRFCKVPFFTESKNGVGKLLRQCTADYKLQPIHRKMRELVGLNPGQRSNGIVAVSMVGISTDEAHRMKSPREKWVSNCYPLIDLGMSRLDCLRWMQKRGYPMPFKSSCTFCPYHDDAYWRDMKSNDAESWAEAVELDELIRNGVKGTKQRLYIHRSLIPLNQVDFRNAEDHGQIDMFGEECEGMCGL